MLLERPGATSEELAEIKRLKREVAEPCRANEILKTASAFSAAEPDRPTPDVCGARKMRVLMGREDWKIGRDQTAGITRLDGLMDVKRSKRVFTTKPDLAGQRPLDLVQRDYKPDAPKRLWVADGTYMQTWQAFA